MIMTEQQLQERYAESEDIRISTYPGKDSTSVPWVILIYSPKMCDSDLMSEVLIPSLLKEWQLANMREHPARPTKLVYELTLEASETRLESVDEIVYGGYVALYFPQFDLLYSYNTCKNTGRSPEESASEISIKGPRDGFVEDLDVNVGLIRKRLKTPNLVYSSFKLGDKSKTSVGMMYLKDKVIPEAVEAVIDKLNQHTGDPPVGIGELVEILSPYRFTILPMFDYTGRTDLAYDSLTRGRLIILMQGCPVVLIAPASFMQLLFAAEDPQMPFYFVFPWRILRLIGFLISILLPGFYITLVSFHQDQIPFPLLATVANTRLGMPIPTGIEMLVILFLLTLLREAGMQMPSPIASTITVVSGIIIGDAAIRGGFFSPTMTVIGALSFVAGSTHSNQDFVVTQTILRFFVLALSSLFGLFGFFIAIFMMVQYAANHKPYGQPYLAPFSPFSLSRIIRNLMRYPGKRKKGGAL